MRKLGYLALAATMLLVLSGGAGASRARTVSGEYNTIVVDTTDPGPGVQGRLSNGVTFNVRSTENSVSLVIEDKVSADVRAIVGQDLDGDGVVTLDESIAEICTRTPAPIKITPGYKVVVWTQEGTCADGTLSTPTFGKITATFTR